MFQIICYQLIGSVFYVPIKVTPIYEEEYITYALVNI